MQDFKQFIINICCFDSYYRWSDDVTSSLITTLNEISIHR